MAKRVYVEIVGDASSLRTALRQSSSAAKQFEREMGRSSRGALAGTAAFKGFGRSIAFASAGFLGAAGFTAVIKNSVSAASDLNEQIDKTKRVFLSSAPVILKWSKGSAEAMGLARREAIGFASTFGAFMRPMGVGAQQAAKMSTRLVQLGSDLASLYNRPVQDALQALQSGLVGQVRPLRQFGVSLDATRLKAEALRLGLMKSSVDQRKVQQANEGVAIAQAKYNEALKKYGEGSIQAAQAHKTLMGAQDSLKRSMTGVGGTLTANQKLMASYSLIFHDTAIAQGNFRATSDQLANQQRILRANLEETQVMIGKALLPSILGVVRNMNDWLGKTENQRRLQEGLKNAVQTSIGVITTVGNVIRGVVGAVGGWVQAGKLLLAVWAAGKISAMAITVYKLVAAIRAIGTASLIASREAKLAVARTGIGLLVVVAAEIILNWQKVKQWFGGFFRWLQINALIGVRQLVEPFSHLPGALGAWARKAKDSINTALEQIDYQRGFRVGTNWGQGFAGGLLQAARAITQGPLTQAQANYFGVQGAVGPTARVKGKSGPVRSGTKAIETATGGRVLGDFATSGHAKNSYHYSGQAIDFAPDPRTWAKLYANRGMFAELFGPWGLYHYGHQFYDRTLQKQHMDHIHVAYTGGPEPIRKALGTGGGGVSTGANLAIPTGGVNLPSVTPLATAPTVSAKTWKGATQATIVSARASVTALISEAMKSIGGIAGPMDEVERVAIAKLKTLREHLKIHMSAADLAQTKASIAKWGKVLKDEVAQQTKEAQRAFDLAAKQILREFDKETQRGLKALAAPDETPTEALLRQREEARSDAQRQQALADAQASGDARAIADAMYDIETAALEKQAAAERKAADAQAEEAQAKYQEQRDDQREALQQQLDDWKDWLTAKKKTWNQFWAWIKANPHGGTIETPDIGETKTAPTFWTGKVGAMTQTGDYVGGPGIKQFASGGIVMGPTLAMIGESGPEAVIPLNRRGHGSSGGVVVNVTVKGALLGSTVPQVAETIRRELLRTSKRNGGVGLG